MADVDEFTNDDDTGDGSRSDDGDASDGSSTLYQLASGNDDDSVHSSNDDLVSNSDVDDDENGWGKKQIPGSTIDFDTVTVVPAQPFCPSDGPGEFFNRFFDTDLRDILVEQTNLYARQSRIRCWQDVTVIELKAFISILIAMGLHEVPSADRYWSSDPLFRVSPISDVMPVKRFKRILQALHINDNSQMPSHTDENFDKLYKLRPMINILNEQFQAQCIPSASQSVDESMILFKGRSTLKQYIPLKPTKRGYKVWVRADSATGYVYMFEVYTGKESTGDPEVGLGGRVVRNLCQPLAHMGVHVTFDNFFSSHELMEQFFHDGIFATATVRSNRKTLPVLARQSTHLSRGESI